jgi:hypothetical protein
VKLPPDAYIAAHIIEIFDCGNPCPETPIYEIRRGASFLAISERSGRIITERIAPGESGAFDFLKEALK